MHIVFIVRPVNVTALAVAQRRGGPRVGVMVPFGPTFVADTAAAQHHLLQRDVSHYHAPARSEARPQPQHDCGHEAVDGAEALQLPRCSSCAKQWAQETFGGRGAGAA